MPMQTPWVDVRSIGAGGGSIAYVDSGGGLKVGPQSAGAEPGPACYGNGGTEPTVTDAAFYLGMLGEGELASGLSLDKDKAEAALRKVSTQLDSDCFKTALGIIRIVCASMANTIREFTVEQGIDLRELTLLSYGGAGPLLATQTARELSIARVVIPAYAGNFSSWGLLNCDLVQSAAITCNLPLESSSIEPCNKYLSELFSDIERNISEHAGSHDDVRAIDFDLRYLGQEHSLTIRIPSVNGQLNCRAEDIEDLFARQYEKRFGIKMNAKIEIVTLRATLQRVLPKTKPMISSPAKQETATPKRLPVYSFAENKECDFTILERSELVPDKVSNGPAIITELTTTTYVDADYKYYMDKYGYLNLVREDT